MQRKRSAPDPNLVTLVIALFLIAVFLTLVYFAIAGPGSAVSRMSLGAPPTPTPLTADAERVVQDMYDAWNSGVGTDYMDAIAPASREKIRLPAVAVGLLEQVQFNQFSAQLPLAYFTDVVYRKMSYSGQLAASDYITVTATGRIWIEALKAEFPMCDVWDVHPYSGEWLVDVDAPERGVRQQRIAAARATPDAWWQGVPVVNGIVDYFSGPTEEGIKKAVNLCE